MLTRKAINKWNKADKEWLKEHPHAKLKEKINHSLKTAKKYLGVKVTYSTLLSAFAPLPKSGVKRIEKSRTAKKIAKKFGLVEKPKFTQRHRRRR